MELTYMPSRSSLLIRSVINIIFGLIIIAVPGLTLLVLAIAFALNLLIVGLFMVFEPAFDKSNKHAVLTVITGILAVGAGIYLMSRPLSSVVILSLILAAWALIIGLSDLFIGFKFSEYQDSDSRLFVLVGIVSIIFAVYLAFNPLEGSLALAWLVGLYALVMGIIYAIQLFLTREQNKPVAQKKTVKKATAKKAPRRSKK